jgi:hypothetical protein
MSDRCEKEVGLAALGWHGAEKGEQVGRSRNGEGKLFIER